MKNFFKLITILAALTGICIAAYNFFEKVLPVISKNYIDKSDFSIE